MNFVYPIKDLETLQRVKDEALLSRNGLRDRAFIEISLNTALRSSDILKKITVKQALSGKITGKAKKTGKKYSFELEEETMYWIRRYVEREDLKNNEYLFNMSRVAVHRFTKRIQERLGLNYDIGVHSYRKTIAYMMYVQKNDIARVMRLLQHTNSSATLAYIAVTEEEIAEDLKEVLSDSQSEMNRYKQINSMIESTEHVNDVLDQTGTPQN